MAKSKTIDNDLVDVFIPKKNKTDQSRFISVNGERKLVQTGVHVMLPRRFAEVLENSERSDKKAEEYIMANASA